jgi:hypothetical protein
MTKNPWQPASNKVGITGFKSLHKVISKKVRPKFKQVLATVVKSPDGKKKMLGMMTALERTPADTPWMDAFVDAKLATRFKARLERNNESGPKAKKHPDAVDFGLGEQIDGAANELRGCIKKKQSGELWEPPEAALKIDKGWHISDPRIFKLIESAMKDQGPLAESANRKMKTTSTSHSRTATFVVDYIAAVITAYNKQFPDGHA